MKEQLSSFVLSQVVAVVNCAVGLVVNGLTEFCGVSLPYTLILCFYALLLFSFCFKEARQRIGAFNTFLVGVFCVLDLGATSLINSSYEFTGVSSVVLITSLATPFSAVFCWLFLRAKLSLEQVLCMFGALFCTAAFICVDWAGGGSVKGSLLALGGTLGYGINTAYNEYLLKRGLAATQILSRLACFGVILALILSMSLELKVLKTAPWQTGLFVPGYALAMVAFYSLQMYAIEKKGAVFLNMAVLCTNFYSMLLGPLIFDVQYKAIQILVALVLVAAVCVFNLL